MTTIKDSKGQYVKVEPVKEDKVPDPELSIDDLLTKGLLTIQRTMLHLTRKSVSGVLSREEIQTLKDMMSMLQDLREHEQEILEKMSDAELEALVSVNK